MTVDHVHVIIIFATNVIPKVVLHGLYSAALHVDAAVGLPRGVLVIADDLARLGLDGLA